MRDNLKETDRNSTIELSDQEMEQACGGSFKDSMLELVPMECPGNGCTNNNLRQNCDIQSLTFSYIRVICRVCGGSFCFYRQN